MATQGQGGGDTGIGHRQLFQGRQEFSATSVLHLSPMEGDQVVVPPGLADDRRFGADRHARVEHQHLNTAEAKVVLVGGDSGVWSAAKNGVGRR